MITGVAGLVGANFAEYLLSKRQEFGINKVIGVDDLSGGYIENLDLKNVNFENAVLWNTDLRGADLRGSNITVQMKTRAIKQFHIMTKVCC